MPKPKVNSNLFGRAATTRREEQQAIEERIRTGEGKKTGRGRPAKNEEPTITVTVRMTADRKQKLKEYAVMNKRTVSDVLSEFVDSLYQDQE